MSKDVRVLLSRRICTIGGPLGSPPIIPCMGGGGKPRGPTPIGLPIGCNPPIMGGGGGIKLPCWNIAGGKYP